MTTETSASCPLCHRIDVVFEDHHLVPVHKGGRKGERALICGECHKQIHALFTNLELRDDYNSLSKLKNAARMQSFYKFIGKKPYGSLTIRESKRRKK